MKRTLFEGAISGDLLSPKLEETLEHYYISIKFYDSGTFTNLVTPTSGAVTFTGSEDGDIFGSINNGVVDMSRVGAGLGYSRPTASGDLQFIKASFSSPVGATHAKILISQYLEG